MDECDYSSDTSDEDYIPEDGEQVSEEENSGDEEEFVLGAEDAEEGSCVSKSSTSKSKAGSKVLRGKKRKTKTSETTARRRKGGIRLEDEPVAEQLSGTSASEVPCKDLVCEVADSKKEEQNKKRADDLWADFLKDVGGSTVSKPASGPQSKQPVSCAIPPKPATVKVTKEYDFAGETVTVVREVLADSKDARLSNSTQPSTSSTSSAPSAAASAPASVGVKRPAAGGLNSVLSKIGKKDKISVLEKSKIDWDGFKEKEGIKDELKIHNRGKDGYLERQAFLQRTDYRQFEIERDLRHHSRQTKP